MDAIQQLNALVQKERDQRAKEHASQRTRLQQVIRNLNQLSSKPRRDEFILRRRLADEQRRLQASIAEYESGAWERGLLDRFLPYREYFADEGLSRVLGVCDTVVQQVRELPNPSSVAHVLRTSTGVASHRGRRPMVLTVARAQGESSFVVEQPGRSAGVLCSVGDQLIQTASVIESAPELLGVLKRLAEPGEDDVIVGQVLSEKFDLVKKQFTADSWRSATLDDAQRARVRRRMARLFNTSFDADAVLREARGEPTPVHVSSVDCCRACQVPMRMTEDNQLVCPSCRQVRDAVCEPVVLRGDQPEPTRRSVKVATGEDYFNRFLGIGRSLNECNVLDVGRVLRAMGVNNRLQITPGLVHFAMEALRGDKWSAGARMQVFLRLTGLPPPRLTPDMNVRLQPLRALASRAFPAFGMRGRRPVAMLSEYLLFKCLQVLGLDVSFAGYFFLHHCYNAEQLIERFDEIWNAEVCQPHGVQYVPTVKRVTADDLPGLLERYPEGVASSSQTTLWKYLHTVTAVTRGDSKRRVTIDQLRDGQQKKRASKRTEEEDEEEDIWQTSDEDACERLREMRVGRQTKQLGFSPTLEGGICESAVRSLEIWWFNYCALDADGKLTQLIVDGGERVPISLGCYMWCGELTPPADG